MGSSPWLLRRTVKGPGVSAYGTPQAKSRLLLLLGCSQPCNNPVSPRNCNTSAAAAAAQGDDEETVGRNEGTGAAVVRWKLEVKHLGRAYRTPLLLYRP